MMNGLERIEKHPDSHYANDRRHRFVQKMLEMYRAKQITLTTKMLIVHKPNCNLYKGYDRYCDCDVIIAPKLEV